jgi:hypothetical protein
MYKKTEDVLFKELLRNCQKNLPRRWDHLVSECCVVISSAYMNYMKHHVLASRGWSAPLLLEIASSKYTVTLNSLDPQIALVPCDKSQHDSALLLRPHLISLSKRRAQRLSLFRKMDEQWQTQDITKQGYVMVRHGTSLEEPIYISQHATWCHGMPGFPCAVLHGVPGCPSPFGSRRDATTSARSPPRFFWSFTDLVFRNSRQRIRIKNRETWIVRS